VSKYSTPEPAIARFVTVDRSSPIPLYYQIAEQLKRAVEAGEITPGTRLANEVELADDLGVSRPTMRKAMEQLVGNGLVVRQRGAGTRVVSPKVLRYLELTSLYDDLQNSGQRPTTRVLSNTVEGASAETADALAVEVGTPVITTVRLRSAMDQPIAILTNYLPAHRLTLTTEDLQTHGLYQLMRRAGIVLHSATQVIGARTATTAEARLLGERRGEALLTMQRTAFDDRRVIVEYGNHIYYAARYSFEMSMLTR
jgi:DNA-binding GntR family transcriptional regulator